MFITVLSSGSFILTPNNKLYCVVYIDKSIYNVCPYMVDARFKLN